MEGPLSVGEWVAVIFMAGAGAWMFLVLRPVSPWTKLIAVFIPTVAGGAVIALAICEYYSLDSIFNKLVSAFFSGLFCMPLSRAVLAVVESEAVKWIKQTVLRVLGVKTSEPEEPQEQAQEIGDSDAG